MDFANKLRAQLKRDIFSIEDIKAIIPTSTDAALHSAITRSLASNECVKLRRGLYLFTKELRRGSVSKFVIANKLYDPSYLSFESALSHHGLIPEAVYTTTSACFQRKSKIFSNELGDFSYDFIPVRPFFTGVTSCSQNGGMLIASPIRALFDHLYLRRKNYISINDFEDDLRIDMTSLKEAIIKTTVLELETLAKAYNKKNIIRAYEILIKAFK